MDISNQWFIIIKLIILIGLSFSIKFDEIMLIAGKIIFSKWVKFLLVPLAIFILILMVNSETSIVWGFDLLNEVPGLTSLNDSLFFNISFYIVMILLIMETSKEIIGDDSEESAVIFGVRIITLVLSVEIIVGTISGMADGSFMERMSLTAAVIYYVIIFIGISVGTVFQPIYVKDKRLSSVYFSNSLILLFFGLSQVMITKVLIVMYLIKRIFKLVNKYAPNNMDFDNYYFLNERLKNVFESLLMANLFPIVILYAVFGRALGSDSFMSGLSLYFSITILLILILPRLNIFYGFTVILAHIISLIGFFGLIFWIQPIHLEVVAIYEKILGPGNVSNVTILSLLVFWVVLLISINLSLYNKNTKKIKIFRLDGVLFIRIFLTIGFGVMLCMTHFELAKDATIKDFLAIAFLMVMFFLLSDNSQFDYYDRWP